MSRRSLAFALALFGLGMTALSLPLTAAPLGDDGLHKPDWLQESFLDLREDLAQAEAEGKRLLLTVEQRGCIYCAQMHAEVLPDPEVDARLRESFFVVQLNLAGALEVTDFDGETSSEKAMLQKWGVNFTPTLIFLPREVPEGVSTREAAVALIPGSPDAPTLAALMDWVKQEGYASGQTARDFLKTRQ